MIVGVAVEVGVAVVVGVCSTVRVAPSVGIAVGVGIGTAVAVATCIRTTGVQIGSGDGVHVGAGVQVGATVGVGAGSGVHAATMMAVIASAVAATDTGPSTERWVRAAGMMSCARGEGYVKAGLAGQCYEPDASSRFGPVCAAYFGQFAEW